MLRQDSAAEERQDKILAFVEVDPRNIDDVKRTIFECGVAYIGFPVPTNLGYDNPVWDYDPEANVGIVLTIP